MTIDEIAAAANVARGTFFNYFESKEAVVVTYGPHEAEVQRSLIATSVHIPLRGQ
ncbi:TetR/AcrR family transcriptional regulator [Streptomyces mirabilis]|uniref:TetR/AcrR family transcriptional regulator n=1 Tax=Streptomyces mirabilis TaxID=68239 RepID=UPI0036E106F3